MTKGNPTIGHDNSRCRCPVIGLAYLYRLEIIRAWARDHSDFWLRLFETIKSLRLRIDVGSATDDLKPIHLLTTMR